MPKKAKVEDAEFVLRCGIVVRKYYKDRFVITDISKYDKEKSAEGYTWKVGQTLNLTNKGDVLNPEYIGNVWGPDYDVVAQSL